MRRMPSTIAEVDEVFADGAETVSLSRAEWGAIQAVSRAYIVARTDVANARREIERSRSRFDLLFNYLRRLSLAHLRTIESQQTPSRMSATVSHANTQSLAASTRFVSPRPRVARRQQSIRKTSADRIMSIVS